MLNLLMMMTRRRGLFDKPGPNDLAFAIIAMAIGALALVSAAAHGGTWDVEPTIGVLFVAGGGWLLVRDLRIRAAYRRKNRPRDRA